jgi:mono/diheme cytochrome c family protein
MKVRTTKAAGPRAGLLSAVALMGLAACGSSTSGAAAPLEDGDDDNETSPSVKDAGPKPDAKTSTPAKDAGKAVADAGTDKSAKNVPCDVAAISAKNCAMCHGAETAFGAPMSLVTLADYKAKSVDGESMLETIKTRINEPNPKKAMPPSNGVKLTAKELATLNDWLEAGAPGSSESCESTKPSAADAGSGGASNDAGLETESLDCFKMTAFGAGASAPYKVGVARDKYVNFTFNAPWSSTAYGIRFSPIISNAKALHHFLLFQDSSKKAPGSAGSSGAHPDGQLVYGWAPGGQPLDLREATDVSVGFELPNTTSYTVEMHYNSTDGAAVDASGVEVCVAKAKPDNIANISWLGYDNLLTPSTKWTGNCVPQNKVPVHILGVQPHMHVAGKHMKTVIHRKGGGEEVLHDEPFDFNNQVHYLKDVTINPGDTLTTECTYDQPMSFGESTGAEMCYNFTFAYPKGLLKDSGPWGGVAHGGSACLGQ